MAAKTTNILPNHPFWIFSLQAYSQESVKKALLNLQNRHGLNINMVLFCYWFAASNQGALLKTDIKQLLTAIHTWHERVVSTLRSLRDRLKEAAAPIWSQHIRQDVLDTELTAEHIEQLLLIDASAKKSTRVRRSHQQRTTHACQNAATYCNVLFINLDQADCTAFGQILAGVFPELTPTEAVNMSRTILLSKQKTKEPTQKQLQLKFS